MDSDLLPRQLRELVRAYLDERVGRVEYLAQRRRLLDSIERECNGSVQAKALSDPDITRPVLSRPGRR